MRHRPGSGSTSPRPSATPCFGAAATSTAACTLCCTPPCSCCRCTWRASPHQRCARGCISAEMDIWGVPPARHLWGFWDPLPRGWGPWGRPTCGTSPASRWTGTRSAAALSSASSTRWRAGWGCAGRCCGGRADMGKHWGLGWPVESFCLRPAGARPHIFDVRVVSKCGRWCFIKLLSWPTALEPALKSSTRVSHTARWSIKGALL